jgi:hypothetical protein
MQRSADASAPAVPTGLHLSGNTLTWDASGDPYVAPTGASGLKEYVITRDGVTLATVPTTPGLSPELTGQDIGAVSPPGTDSQSGASHNMRAAGARIYFAADEFRFKYATVTGDCTINGGTVTHLANAGGSTATDRLALKIAVAKAINDTAQALVPRLAPHLDALKEKS